MMWAQISKTTKKKQTFKPPPSSPSNVRIAEKSKKKWTHSIVWFVCSSMCYQPDRRRQWRYWAAKCSPWRSLLKQTQINTFSHKKKGKLKPNVASMSVISPSVMINNTRYWFWRALIIAQAISIVFRINPVSQVCKKLLFIFYRCKVGWSEKECKRVHKYFFAKTKQTRKVQLALLRSDTQSTNPLRKDLETNEHNKQENTVYKNHESRHFGIGWIERERKAMRYCACNCRSKSTIIRFYIFFFLKNTFF